MLNEVIKTFNAALRHVWYLAFALTLVTILPSFLIKWMNLKKVAKQRAEEKQVAKGQTAETVEEARESPIRRCKHSMNVRPCKRCLLRCE